MYNLAHTCVKSRFTRLGAQFHPWTVFFTTTYEHNSDYEDRGGMFMMKHRANSMLASTSNSALKPEDVWFVDSGASNHMTSHKECVKDVVRKQE